ncbi:hypothetical protein DL766_004895 [Monosporascus sp. MC13-8B]|uniref:Uncharacterized protein n=1 Tax=Monosporascus cannonballus TaxID=155416 RepID=A0ABY0HDE6_9PEZI|nr:hypothetical protein DL762_002894 [Monosporascus cannonballus]RYO95415.1 hypothetical protein DL763_003720 [Monosporascus cannonballus]RYP30350.1 hypothetical protein DL766_004895 [Monosporascus sp. MC13-8B]
MARKTGHESAPMDEILQLHQNIHLLGPGIRECLVCCTNNDVMAALLDGLATLCILYEAARIKYWEASAPGDVTRDSRDSRAQIHPAAHPFPGDSAAPAERTGEGTNGHRVHPTPKSVPNAMPSVVLGRIQLTDSETNLVYVTLIRQGLRQTGSHLRDLQQHLTKCLMAKRMESSTYHVYKRRVIELLSGIYSSLACI